MRFILMLAFVLVIAAHVCDGKDLRSVVEEKVEKKKSAEIGMIYDVFYLFI